MPNLTVRSMTKSELKMVIDWTIMEGWNFGKHDIDAYYEAYPESFKLLLLDEKPIAGISIVKYDNNFAYLGLFIVDKVYRGSGYGTYLWNWSMSFLSKEIGCKGVSGLYAVPKQIPRYQLSGYQTDSGLQRWQGLAPKNTLNEMNKNITNISNKVSSLFNEVLNYDKNVFFADRTQLIKSLIKLPQTKAFIYYDNNQKISGYGILRSCQNGFRLGPLYADSLESAKSLAEALFNTVACTNEPIFMDSPVTNKFSKLFVEYFNLSHIADFDTTLMFKGDYSKYLLENINKNYAIASLELG